MLAAAAFFKVFVAAISSLFTVGSVTYMWLDDSFGWYGAYNFTDTTNGVQYYVTSFDKSNEKVVYDEIPDNFVSADGLYRSYVCKIDLIDQIPDINGDVYEEITTFYDHTCAIYKLDNFDKNGTKTFNLPTNIDPSMLLSNKESVESSHHQLVRFNRKFLEQMPRGGTTVSVIDRRTYRKTYMTLKLDFLFSLAEEKQMPSNLFSVWIKHKATRHPSLRSITFNKDSKFNCLIGLIGPKIPCKLYKYADKKTSNNLTYEDLKNIQNITDFDKDYFENSYYVLDLLGKKFSFDQIANKDIDIYEDIDNTSDALSLSLVYDRQLLGRYTQPTKHNIYFTTPKKRIFLAKKSSTNSEGLLTAPELNTTTQNYRCKIDAVLRTSKDKVDNFDNSCKLYDLPSLGNKKSLALTPETLKEANTLTINSKLSSDTFFKLELDENRLFNLGFDPTTPTKHKVRIVPNVPPTNGDKDKHYIELDIVQELNEDENKLEGKSHLLLVQAWGSSMNFIKNKDDIIKCKFFEGAEPFNCDLYQINNQSTPLKDLDTKEGLDELDLLPASLVDFSVNNSYKNKTHYIVDIKTPRNLKELIKRKKYFYIYKENTETPLPGQPTFEAKAKEKLNADTNKESTAKAVTPKSPSAPSSKITFSIQKIIDADLTKTGKSAIILN